MLKLWVIRIGFVCAFLALVGNLYMLQVGQQNHYAQQAHARYSDAHTSEVDRGSVYFTDKYGTSIPAVLNKEYAVVYAVPEEVADPQGTAHILASILSIDEQTTAEKLAKPGDLYELLLEKATTQQTKDIKDAALAGIYITSDTFRYYPFGKMASQTLGFVGPSDDGSVKGRYGLEYVYDDKLISAEGDNEVFLSIDRNVQAEAGKIISALYKQWNAKSASMIVQDPATGKILGMANVPSFDPNNYKDYALKDFLNPLIQEVYEPGSVFKVITIASGIDSGAITKDTTYYDSGSVTLNASTIHNWDLKSHGTQTMANVIEQSLNTGAVFAEQRLGHSTFEQYMQRFGFGKKTGIAFPGEVSGDISLSGRRDINYATASFGQGISVTPIQMISAFSAIANGGVLMVPSLLEDEKPQIVRRVINQETAETMAEVLVKAVDVNAVAHIPQYKIAAKTGTAYIPDFVNGGYSDDVINTYIGFAPTTNAQFTVLVRLERPEGSPLAGQTVVPAFKEMVEFLLNYYEVAPDRPQE